MIGAQGQMLALTDQAHLLHYYQAGVVLCAAGAAGCTLLLLRPSLSAPARKSLAMQAAVTWIAAAVLYWIRLRSGVRAGDTLVAVAFGLASSYGCVFSVSSPARTARKAQRVRERRAEARKRSALASEKNSRS